MAEFFGRSAERAVDRYVWIPISFRDADLFALGRHAAFGRSNIRAASKQIGRNSHDHFRRRGRNRSRTNSFLQILRRHSHQDAKLVRRLTQPNLQLRNGRLRGIERAACLVDVELADRAGFEARFDDVQRITLDFHVLLGVSNTLLKRAHLRVVRSDVA